MIAIEITQQIKDQNEHAFVQNAAVGQIVKRGAYPKKFSVTTNNAGGYDLESAELHAADGWGTLTKPPFNKSTERLGEIIPDGSDFTYAVIDLSEEEIADALELAQEAEAEQSYDAAIEAGRALFQKSYKKMFRRKTNPNVNENNKLTLSDCKKFMRWNEGCYTSLSFGSWFQAENRILKTITDETVELAVNTPLRNMCEWLRDEIVDYVDNVYDLNNDQ